MNRMEDTKNVKERKTKWARENVKVGKIMSKTN